MDPIIGIDLGTTNSTVTSIDSEGKTTVIKNQYGEFITPSAVYFTDQIGKVIVGKEAKKMSAEDPNNLVMFVKREMGKSKDEVRFDKIEREAKPYDFWGKRLSPEEISAYILGQLKQDAERALNRPVKKAVITCPAYFGQKEKEATRVAGEMAGFEVLDVLPEPTAAAFKYSAVSNKDKENIFVFDLGGGTFDVTILTLERTPKGMEIKTVKTDGDRKLGGIDWDKNLDGYMREQFYKKFHQNMDYESGPEAEITLGKLVLDCERAKKDLYKEGANETSITMEYRGGVITETITRAQYEAITELSTNRCKVYCDNILKEAGMSWNDIDTVLMVGSMSNCGSVQNALRRWSGRDISFGFINPKTCVSEGAAICAFLHEGGTTVKTLKDNPNYDKIEEGFCLAEDVSKAEESGERVETKIAFATNVISSSIRLKGFFKGTPTAKLFLEKNTTYPTSKSFKIPIGRDDLSEVKLEILEGETDNPANCIVLGDALLPLRGSHTKEDLVEVTIKVDNNGIIQTEGVDLKTGEKVDAVIRRQGALSKEEIDKAKDVIEDMFTLTF